jgi:hypothetical protein
MRRGADHPRAAVSIGRAALGQAPDRLQKQHVLFGEHGISSSELAPPLSGETQGIHQPAMLPDVNFRKFSWNHKNGFVRRVKYFVPAACTKPRLPNR